MTRLDELKGRVQLRGFRPGKVPVAHLKRIYGRSVMAEAIEADGPRGQCQDRHGARLQARARAEGHAADRGGRGRGRHRWQGRPRLHGRDGDRCRRSSSPISRASSSSGSVAEVTDAEIDEAMKHDRRAEPAVRRQGRRRQGRDRATASPSTSSARSTGRRSRAAPARTSPLVIGSITFIPGFEEQLIGIGAGENAHRQRDFPDELSEPDARRQGRRIRRHREVGRGAGRGHDRRRIRQVARHGIARQAQRRGARNGIAREHAAATRQKLKRALLDELDERHKFEPPPSWSKQEFDQRLAARSRTTSSSRAAPSRTRARPRRRRAEEYRESPSAACGSAW